MIVKVDLERGISPIAAVRCSGKNGNEARTIEEALDTLNQYRTGLTYRMYGSALGRSVSLYGMLKHPDGFVQVIVESRNLVEALQRAINLLVKRAA